MTKTLQEKEIESDVKWAIQQAIHFKDLVPSYDLEYRVNYLLELKDKLVDKKILGISKQF